ncbi:hypothetical protein AVEN_138656-1 [Araneus ventricosus]|uniref:Uncharacterized protein n=1 Tax=Araneus ventricosus TaxID=182803 RepID=A0A4Y2E3D0_ARAVE|nr:hypothetical protein AVEN_138656-1 [Araneus ventricosus]
MIPFNIYLLLCNDFQSEIRYEFQYKKFSFSELCLCSRPDSPKGLLYTGLVRLNLDIQDRTVPHHLERLAPDRSSFQSIHLGGPFMDTTGHFNLAGLLCLPLLPLSKRDPAHHCRAKASLRLLHFVVFAFVKEHRFPLPAIVFQFYALVCRMKIRKLATGFGTACFKWCGAKRS